MHYLQTLPNELIVNILLYSQPVEVARYRQISQRFLGIIDSSSKLKLVLQLYLDGRLIINPSLHSTAVAMERHRATQRNLQAVSPHIIQTEFQGPHRYCIESGTCAILTTTGMTITKISEEGQDIQFKYPTPPDTNLVIWAASINNDLLAICRFENDTYRLHLSCLSTNEPHPNTLSSVLDVFAHTDGSTRSMQFCGDSYVLILFSPSFLGHLEAHLWDWRKGTQIWVIRNVYRVVKLDKLKLFAIVERDYTAKVYAAIVSLEAGTLEVLLEIPISGGIDIAVDITTSDDGLESKEGFDISDPLLGIISIDFAVAHLSSMAEFLTFRLVISKDALMRKVAELQRANSQTSRISWHEWGPKTSRLFPVGGGIRFLRLFFLSGSKIVCFSTTTDFQDFRDSRVNMADDGAELVERLTVLDFNPRRLHQLSSAVPSDTELDGSTTVIIVKEPWKFNHIYLSSTMETCLPFRAFMRAGGRGASWKDVAIEGMIGDVIIGRSVPTFTLAFLNFSSSFSE